MPARRAAMAASKRWARAGWALGCALGCALAAADASGQAAVEVQRLRMSPESDRVRIVLDLSAPLDCQHQWRERPLRLELECANAVLLAEPNTLSLARTPIQRIRHRQTDAGALQLVFDMRQRLPLQKMRLPPNQRYRHHRLVIDLAHEPPAAPRLAVPKPPRQLLPNIGSGHRTPALPVPSNRITVAIDAGHGGKDPGSVSEKYSLREASLVLDIAQRLARLFQQVPGYRPFLVRDGDVFLGLAERVARARAQHADIFLSIHANAFKPTRSSRRRQPKGSAVYRLSYNKASSTEAKFLARHANNETAVSGSSLDWLLKSDAQMQPVLLNLRGQDTRGQSQKLGKALLESLEWVNPLHKKHVESANFKVLRAPDIPSLLVEVGFLSNAEEARALREPKHRQRIATALFNGVDSYVRAHNRYGMPPGRRAGAKQYTVRAGDTLSALAGRSKASLDEIKRLNALQSDMLKVGQTLMLPAR